MTIDDGLVTTDRGRIDVMIEALVGSEDAERVLLFLAARGEGQCREIAGFWQTNLSGIQRQLNRFERGGLLIQRQVGRTRVYSWNPRWPFREELANLLKRAIEFLPIDQHKQLVLNRRRPRRQGKPL